VGGVEPRVGLSWVGTGSKISVFRGLGWVMRSKWQICKKCKSCIGLYVTLCRVFTGKFDFMCINHMAGQLLFDIYGDSVGYGFNWVGLGYYWGHKFT